VKSGRGWAPKTEPTGTPGSYYLRYLKNGRRTFESVGDDLQMALQELKARQASLNALTPVTIITQPKTVRTVVQAFLCRKTEIIAIHLGRIRRLVWLGQRPSWLSARRLSGFRRCYFDASYDQPRTVTVCVRLDRRRPRMGKV